VCSCLHYQRPRAKGTLQTRPASGTHSTQHAPTQGSERSPKPSERAATFFDRSNSWGWLQNSNGNRHSHTPFKILKTFELGSPSSFAIARPVSPRALRRATASRCSLTFAGRPSLIPLHLACAKPSWIHSVAAERLNSSIASSVSRNTLSGTLEVLMR